MKKHLILLAALLLSCAGWYFLVQSAALPELADQPTAPTPVPDAELQNISLQTLQVAMPPSLDEKSPPLLSNEAIFRKAGESRKPVDLPPAPAPFPAALDDDGLLPVKPSLRQTGAMTPLVPPPR